MIEVSLLFPVEHKIYHHGNEYAHCQQEQKKPEDEAQRCVGGIRHINNLFVRYIIIIIGLNRS